LLAPKMPAKAFAAPHHPPGNTWLEQKTHP
jgi:hypothetical protein